MYNKILCKELHTDIFHDAYHFIKHANTTKIKNILIKSTDHIPSYGDDFDKICLDIVINYQPNQILYTKFEQLVCGGNLEYAKLLIFLGWIDVNSKIYEPIMLMYYCKTGNMSKVRELYGNNLRGIYYIIKHKCRVRCNIDLRTLFGWIADYDHVDFAKFIFKLRMLCNLRQHVMSEMKMFARDNLIKYCEKGCINMLNWFDDLSLLPSITGNVKTIINYAFTSPETSVDILKFIVKKYIIYNSTHDFRIRNQCFTYDNARHKLIGDACIEKKYYSSYYQLADINEIHWINKKIMNNLIKSSSYIEEDEMTRHLYICNHYNDEMCYILNGGIRIMFINDYDTYKSIS